MKKVLGIYFKGDLDRVTDLGVELSRPELFLNNLSCFYSRPQKVHLLKPSVLILPIISQAATSVRVPRRGK